MIRLYSGTTNGGSIVDSQENKINNHAGKLHDISLLNMQYERAGLYSCQLFGADGIFKARVATLSKLSFMKNK